MDCTASCPSRRVLKIMRKRVASGKASRLVNKLSDGRSIAALVQPRSDGGWVVTHEDITERETLNAQLARQNQLLRQREEELKDQNTRFNAAIDNMLQGVCLFDADRNVVFANQRYAQLYGLTPDQVKPGTSLQEIIEARVANGAYDELDRGQGCERLVSPGSAIAFPRSSGCATAASYPCCAGRWPMAASSVRTRTSPSASD